MYELLLVVLIIFCLNGVISIIQKREKFRSYVSALTEPIKEVAYYYPKSCSRDINSTCIDGNKNYTYLPYRQKPAQSQIFCPPHVLYNTSCNLNSFPQQYVSHELTGPYTTKLNTQNAPAPISSYYPKVINTFTYPFTSGENIHCITDEHNVQRCIIGRNL